MENKLSPPSHLASCEQTESTAIAPWALLLPIQKIPSRSISDIGSITSAVLTVEHVRKPHTLLIVSWNNLLGNKKKAAQQQHLFLWLKTPDSLLLALIKELRV